MAQVEAGGAAVTLETSEPLFLMGAAMNACGGSAGPGTGADFLVVVSAATEHKQPERRVESRDAAARGAG